MFSLAGQKRLVKRLLDRVEHPSSRLRQIAGKIAKKCSLGESSFVAVEDNAGRGGRRRKLARQGSVILFCIWSPRRDVDDSGNVWMNAGFRNDHPRKGMSRQHCRPVLTVQHALRFGYGIIKRR